MSTYNFHNYTHYTLSRCPVLPLWVLNGGHVHHGFYEDGVVFNEATLVELSKGDKARTPAGHIHVCLGLLEAAAQWIWLEHINNVSSMMLVDETE